MTQTHYVSYGDKGFWVYDVGLSVFLKYLIDEAVIYLIDRENPWLDSAVSKWRIVACISPYGISFDDSLPESQIEILMSFIDGACLHLSERKVIPGIEIECWQILDDHKIFLRGASEVHTGPLVELGQAIIQLFSGTLPPDPDGGIYIYGTPSGREFYPNRY